MHMRTNVTLHRIVSLPADRFCKQFESRSDPIKCRASPGFKRFDALLVFLKEIFEKNDLKKYPQTIKSIKITQEAELA